MKKKHKDSDSLKGPLTNKLKSINNFIKVSNKNTLKGHKIL